MLIKLKVGSLKSLVKLRNTRQTFQEKREKMQITNIKLKSKITTDFNKMEYYVQIFVNKFNNLLKMNKSFERYKLTKLTQEGIET